MKARISPNLETVVCNLCGAEDAELYLHAPVRPQHRGQYDRDVWDVVRCRRCGLIYVNPRLDAEALYAFYEFQNEGDRAFVEDWFIESADLQRPTWNRFLDVLAREQTDGRLLDVGCGAGSFLVEAERRGYDVVGTEISPYFVQYCRERHGLDVYEGLLEDLPLQRGSFDVVTAFDVIEHHLDPTQLLQQIHDLLRPGGVVVFSTHDIGNVFARLYGDRWRHMSPVGHLTYFTRPTLRAMLRKTGFRLRREGGLHTIDATGLKTARNWAVQFLRVILLRSLILGVYQPLTRLVPALRRWRINLGNAALDHQKLMVRVGTQVIMNDDMVMIAEKIERHDE